MDAVTMLYLFGPYFYPPYFLCHLDHRFVGFCTGVLIKDLVHANGSADFFCQQSLRNGVRVVKSMHDIFYLILHCCYHFLIRFQRSLQRFLHKNPDKEFRFRHTYLIFCCLSQKIESLISLDHTLSTLSLMSWNVSPVSFNFIVLSSLIFVYECL